MDKAQLIKHRKFFERKTDSCGLLHEDVKRDAAGKAILSGITYDTNVKIDQMLLAECAHESQHFGCPHFFNDYVKPAAEKIIELLREARDSDAGRLELEVMRLGQFLFELDTDVRVARSYPTKKKTDWLVPVLYDYSSVPSRTEAEQKVAPLLLEYENKKTRIEQFRLEMLGKIEMLIQSALL